MNLFKKDKEKNIQDAQVIETTPTAHKDTLALEALRTKVSTSKEDFRKQLANVKDAIEVREEELKNLIIKKHKLQGAIEASDIYLQQSPTSK